MEQLFCSFKFTGSKYCKSKRNNKSLDSNIFKDTLNCSKQYNFKYSLYKYKIFGTLFIRHVHIFVFTKTILYIVIKPNNTQ